MVLCCLHPSFSKRPAGERDLRLSAKVGWGGSQPFFCLPLDTRDTVCHIECIEHLPLMKLFTALAALTITASPAFAACTTGNFIQVGNQIACIRRMQGEELKVALAERDARNAERARKEAEAEDARRAQAARQQRDHDMKVNKENTRELGRIMDAAGDRILEPGGKERYREAMDAHRKSAVIDLQYEYGLR
jgi:hypothetical protein